MENRTLRDVLGGSQAGFAGGSASSNVVLNKATCNLMFTNYIAATGLIDSDVTYLAEVYAKFIPLSGIAEALWEKHSGVLASGNMQTVFGRQTRAA